MMKFYTALGLLVFLSLTRTCGAKRRQGFRIPHTIKEDIEVERDIEESTCISFNYASCDPGDNDCYSVQTCSPGSPYCYSLWKPSSNAEGATEMFLQGCWTSPDESECSRDRCEATEPNRHGFYFCCCYGENCNEAVHTLS
ncbi:uncharacterized protein LOC144433410 [Glandiceps talaboti]